MEEIYQKIKPHITPKIFFISLIVLILIIVFFNLSRIFSFPDTAWPLEKGEKEKIHTEVIQKFIASRDGLSGVKILFGSSDVSPGGTLNLKIYQENCQKIVREVDLGITKLNSNNATNFNFPKIKDSAEKTFCLNLSYIKKGGGKKAEIFVIENPRSENKYFSLNGEETQGKAIPFRPTYKNATVFGDIYELNQRLSQYKPWFLKHYFMYFVSFGFLVLSVALIIILIILI